MTPPNNPLVNDLAGDTLNNIHAALTALKILLSGNDVGQVQLSPTATHGLGLLLSCVLDAVQHEASRSQITTEEA